MDLSPAGLAHAAFFLVLVPWRVVKTKRALDAGTPLPPSAQLLRGTLVVQLVFVAIGLAVTFADQLPLLEMHRPSGRDLLLTLAALAFIVGTIPLRWRMTDAEGRRRLARSMPQSAVEMAWWTPIALAAGFGEELNYRGVLVGVIWIATGSWWLAAALSALAFAVGHATQGWMKVGWILLFTVIVQALVVATGTLWLAMAMHAIYDLIAGVVYGRLTRGLRDGAAAAALSDPARRA